MSENKVKSALSLKRLFFDRIEFHRQGIKNDNETTKSRGSVLCFISIGG